MFAMYVLGVYLWHPFWYISTQVNRTHRYCWTSCFPSSTVPGTSCFVCHIIVLILCLAADVSLFRNLLVICFFLQLLTATLDGKLRVFSSKWNGFFKHTLPGYSVQRLSDVNLYRCYFSWANCLIIRNKYIWPIPQCYMDISQNLKAAITVIRCL